MQMAWCKIKRELSSSYQSRRVLRFGSDRQTASAHQAPNRNPAAGRQIFLCFLIFWGHWSFCVGQLILLFWISGFHGEFPHIPQSHLRLRHLVPLWWPAWQAVHLPTYCFKFRWDLWTFVVDASYFEFQHEKMTVQFFLLLLRNFTDTTLVPFFNHNIR